MSQTVYFGPGPSQLFPGVDQFISKALEDDVCSISHRSKDFKDIYEKTVVGLRKLISLPENWKIVFISSASESWERIILNAVQDRSYHFVNGSFSKKFFQYAQEQGVEAHKFEVPAGEGVDAKQADIPEMTELISFTHNETSTGVFTQLNDIYDVRSEHPDSLISVDVVSSLPYPDIDFSKIDTAYFSVQKCFGLPAGLGVWMVNDRFLEKAKKMANSDRVVGAHHNLLDMVSKGEEFQTLETPNVLGIYLLGEVIEQMNQKGAQMLRKETDEKAQLLYDLVEQSAMFDYAVADEKYRSKTVIVLKTKSEPSEINEYLKPFGMQVGAGYGSFKKTQIRIANFPAHSIDNVKKLVECLQKFEDR